MTNYLLCLINVIQLQNFWKRAENQAFITLLIGLTGNGVYWTTINVASSCSSHLYVRNIWVLDIYVFLKPL